jgi:hypothetical protein
MKSNPERTAWIILLTAFGTFCFLTLFIPASIYWYATNSTDPLTTELTSVRGIVLIGEPEAELSSSVTDGNTVPLEESPTVVTNDTSQAILTFADDSTLTMYGDTTIILLEAQEPRFAISPNPTKILVEVLNGRVRATASRSREDLNFDIQTPDASVELDQGSFSIEVTEKGTQVITRLGQADVMNGDKTVTLNQGQRAVADQDSGLSEPLPAAQNLLSDGSFNPSFTDSWDTYTIDLTDVVTTTAEVVVFQGRYTPK